MIYAFIILTALGAEVDAENPPARAPSVMVKAAPGEGVTISTSDDRFSLTARGRVQIRDTVTAQAEKPALNEINVKTARLWLTGRALTPDLSYGLQLALGGGDFEAGSPSPIFDAFIDYKGLRDLNLRVGQFLVPFDRLRTVREFALELVDRPFVLSELSLDRDVGIAISSSDLFDLGGVLHYSLGVFGGDGKNRFGGVPAGFLYTARVAVKPFGNFDDDIEGDLERSPKPRLAIGGGLAYNDRSTRQRSTTGNTLTLGTFSYRHAAADVVFKWRGLAIEGEALWRSAIQPYRGGAQREWSRSGYGFVAQAGFMVTSSLEVIGRFEALKALPHGDPAVAAQVRTQGNAITGGASYYFNRHLLKVQADYTYGFGELGQPVRHVVRAQVDASL